MPPFSFTVILGLDPRIQTTFPHRWFPAFAGMTIWEGGYPVAVESLNFHFRNGLARISVAIVESGPWPGCTIVSGGRVSSLVLMPFISWS